VIGGPNSGYVHDLDYGTGPRNLGNMPEGKLADAVVSSPPWAGIGVGKSGSGEGPNNTWRDGAPKSKKEIARRNLGEGYGDASGQLANMPEGEFDGVVASPEVARKQGDDVYPDGRKRRRARDDWEGYGATDGQLAALPEGEFEAVVSSPPYSAGTIGAQGYGWFAKGEGGCQVPPEKFHGANYGESEGQLDNADPDTFWSAARQIVQQVYPLLARLPCG
jgi:hypothetical protein